MRDDDGGPSWQTELHVVQVDQKPSLLALYRTNAAGGATGEVVAWAVALPDGAAVVVPLDPADKRPILTTLRGVRRRWAPMLDAILVKVTGRETLNPAA